MCDVGGMAWYKMTIISLSSNVIGDDRLLPFKRIMFFATKKLMILGRK
jgi:hypothetical protein